MDIVVDSKENQEHTLQAEVIDGGIREANFFEENEDGNFVIEIDEKKVELNSVFLDFNIESLNILKQKTPKKDTL